MYDRFNVVYFQIFIHQIQLKVCVHSDVVINKMFFVENYWRTALMYIIFGVSI